MKSLFLIIQLLLASLALAQDSEFYQKDFAKNPLDGEAPITKKLASPTEIPGATPTPMPINSKPVELTPNTTPIPTVEPGTPIKVRSVGGILNCVNREHCFEKLSEILTLVTEKNLLLGKIYLIGGYETIGEILTDMMRVNQFNGRYLEATGMITSAYTVPERYKVEKSPSWIVETEVGEVILEATGSLSKFFNAQGRFVDKSEW